MWELAHELESYVRLPPVDLPGWDGGEITGNALNDPVTAATVLRSQWGLGEGPIPHMVRLLESRGIIVAILPYLSADSRKLDGFSTSRLPRPVVILNEERNDVYRHRFSAAHELGHLILHGEAHPGDVHHERQADAFAAAFLTPSHAIATSLPSRVDFTKLSNLQQSWGVSLDSLLVRCREMGLHSDATSSRAWRRLKLLRSQGLLPSTPVEGFPGEIPTMLKQAFAMARRKGVTEKKLADELRWDEEDIRTLLYLDDPRPALHLV
ncbi:ImmA/IrrE family metallo-endopeptidase [Streptomyces coeruleorubidus]|uniref:ImmA/IrrE family metallo-endopeptidase n=1 Tax=Streptomyces coeruleorubidus TaxID=116188 RepID=UPI00365FC0D9